MAGSEPKITLLCLCGHDVNRHMSAGGSSTPMCCDCFLVGNPDQPYWHPFKMDNLHYLEMKDKENDQRNIQG